MMRYSRFTRFLHALIAVLMILQLSVSLVMEHPHARRAMEPVGLWFFRWHEYMGITLLVLLAVSWLYRFATWRREAQGDAFPWLHASGRAALASELKAFARLRWNALPEHGALAGTVQGAGLLLGSALAVTGLRLYLLLGPDDSVTQAVESLGDIHSALGNIMWAYLGGHACMALWHQYTGHGTMVGMFSFWKRKG